MACKYLESRSPMLLSHHRVKRKQEENNHGVAISLNFGSEFKKFFGHVGLAEQF